MCTFHAATMCLADRKTQNYKNLDFFTIFMGFFWIFMSAGHVIPTCTLGDKLSLGYQTFKKIDQKILCLRLELEAEEVLTFLAKFQPLPIWEKKFLVFFRFFGV